MAAPRPSVSRFVARLISRLLGLTLLCSVVAACGSPEGPSDPRVTVRDSAGITIVENEADAASAQDWRLADEPRLRIGAVEGPGEEQFFDVADAVRVRGGIAVADGGSREIRLFEETGAFLRSFGGEGEGPEEFQSPTALWTSGDTLDVFDDRLQRFSTWTLDGELLGVRRIPPGLPQGEALGRFADGDLLVARLAFDLSQTRFEWQSMTFHRIDRDGERAERIAEYPWMRYGAIEGVGGGPPHFASRTVAAAHGERLYVGTGREYEVEVLRIADRPTVELAPPPGGWLARLVRWRGPPREVTGDHLARLRDFTLAACEGEEARRACAERFDAFPVAERLPAFDDIAVARDGHLWIHEVQGVPPGRRWLVFDPEGGLEARIELPSSLRPLEMDADTILGVERDELGIEYVVLYEIRKAPS